MRKFTKSICNLIKKYEYWAKDYYNSDFVNEDEIEDLKQPYSFFRIVHRYSFTLVEADIFLRMYRENQEFRDKINGFNLAFHRTTTRKRLLNVIQFHGVPKAPAIDHRARYIASDITFLNWPVERLFVCGQIYIAIWHTSDSSHKAQQEYVYFIGLENGVRLIKDRIVDYCIDREAAVFEAARDKLGILAMCTEVSKLTDWSKIHNPGCKISQHGFKWLHETLNKLVSHYVYGSYPA